ncbi:MAG: hemolysin family protein [SAR202 cluster bacterium]|jgi:putative hemolysin|nr:hemolysin family protein [SAR202 cluster bacterium]MDP6514152.1 hemolysin family protein [SAR202 cluster bacterium]
MVEGGTLSLILVGVFLVFSAFFSSSEAAFLSLQRTRITHLVSTGIPGAKRVADMISQPERLLATILLGNNLMNVAFTSVVTVSAVEFVGPDNQGQGVAIATAVSTVALLLAGEIVPKTIAVRNAERVAFIYARPLKWTEYLLLPFVGFLQWITRGLNAILGASLPASSITEGELRTLIDIGESEGTFETSEAEMLEKVFQFGDGHVREVMTPRVEMVSITEGGNFREFLDIYAQNTHTRFPVFTDTVDDITGIISAKDLLNKMATEGVDYDASATDVQREAYFVPETKRISELFDELRQYGHQMAIVIDEFGGVAGLVTLKRLLEVVVGPVGEEGEAPEEEFRAIDENTFHIEGGMSIQEVSQELDIELPEGEFETIAGFALENLGHIPALNEEFEFENLKFEIIDMQGLRIEEIKVTKTDPPVDETATESDSSQIH